MRAASLEDNLITGRCDVVLIFPPSWTYCTGSPHLALPLLCGALKADGIRSKVFDLNWEFGRLNTCGILANDAQSACLDGSMEKLNVPYFKAEDRLNSVARQYGGHWNAQSGFEYDDIDIASSVATLSALRKPSPFTDWYRDVIVPRIADLSPRIIGFTIAAIQQFLPCLQLCCALRDAGFDGAIVLGGNTVSRLWGELRLPALYQICDGFIRFQGERAIVALYRAVESQSSLGQVPSLLWSSNGVIRENKNSEAINLCKLSPPDFSGLPVGQYWGKNYLSLVAARGCYYGRCSFCAIPYGWGQGGYAGAKSPKIIFDDMRVLAARHGIRRFKFVDESMSPQFMKGLAELLIAHGATFEWEGYVRFESVWYQPEFVELLARSGFKKGYFGLELLPSSGRDLMNKSDNPQPERLLALCSAAGVRIHFFCMVGFPGTGVSEAEETVRFLVENSNRIDTADFFPWTYARHTVVPCVQPIINPDRDWTLEFDHAASNSILSSNDVRRLADACEDIIWDEAPHLLHPTYRLVSPWTTNDIYGVDARDDDKLHSTQIAELGVPEWT